MAIEVDWYDEDHDTILIEVKGVWTWEEMATALTRCNEMFDSVSYLVYTIFDFTNASRLPQGVLTNLRRLNRSVHPNSGAVMLVGLSAGYRLIMDVFARLYGKWINPHGTNVLNTRAQADAFLLKLRSERPKNSQ